MREQISILKEKNKEILGKTLDLEENSMHLSNQLKNKDAEISSQIIIIQELTNNLFYFKSE